MDFYMAIFQGLPLVLLAAVSCNKKQPERQADTHLIPGPQADTHPSPEEGNGWVSANGPKRHLLVWQENPAAEVLVNWGVEGFDAAQEHVVYYGRSPQLRLNPRTLAEGKVVARESGMAESCLDPAYANLQAKLAGLEAGTTYYYIAVSNGKASPQMHFKTAPKVAAQNTASSFKFLAGGDSRSDQQQRRTMNAKIQKLVENNDQYLALLHGGDFTGHGADCHLWREWLEDHQETITRTGRVLPVLATFGNHELMGERNFEALFGSPLGKNKFYFRTQIGNLTLLILNSEISVEGNQMRWLQGQFAELSQGAAQNDRDQFVAVSYHRPAWPAVKRPASTTAWVPYFEKYKVDLVFESDGHNMKQTCPIKDKQCNAEEGVVYVGEGGLGVEQRISTNASAWYFEGGGYALPQHHVQSIEVRMSPELGKSKLVYEVNYDGAFHHPLELPAKFRG